MGPLKIVLSWPASFVGWSIRKILRWQTCVPSCPASRALPVTADRDVREILARELLANASLGADVVFAIVADDDDLALPFIKANPSFNCQVQCAVLQVGDQKRCSALASRADISPAAVRRIVNDGLRPKPPFALLNNEHVRLGTGYCRKLYNRFHDQPKVCAVLMEAPYLPPEIALVHNQRTADEMRRTAKLQGWVADFRSDDYISDNEELTALRILDSVCEDGKLQNIVALMSTRGMLTTSLLLRAGIQGKMPFFRVGAGLPCQHVVAPRPAGNRKIIGADGQCDPAPCRYSARHTRRIPRHLYGGLCNRIVGQDR
jgi:hypothetical protein